MSDDDTEDFPNSGESLPGNDSATHNVSLSPIFLARSGNNTLTSGFVNIQRGRFSAIWSSNIYTEQGAYYIQADHDHIYPSQAWHGDNRDGRTLRCLVSTTNS